MFGNKSVDFDASRDIPSLAGKVVLVTGANVGLGKQCVLEFARHKPAAIWLAARDVEKAKAAIDDIKIKVPDAVIVPLQLNLASFASVKRAAQEFSAASDRLDILMLNAGIMASAAGLTQDEYEIQFGTNHLGHALLTKLLLPILEKTANHGPDADVRVVVVSSGALKVARGRNAIRFDVLKSKAEDLSAFTRYDQSKLANALFARELAKRHPKLRVASVDPGPTKTNLQSSMTGLSSFFRWVDKALTFTYSDVEVGVKTQLWACVDKNFTSGEYFMPVGVAGKATAEGTDDELARKLWEWTSKELEGQAI